MSDKLYESLRLIYESHYLKELDTSNQTSLATNINQTETNTIQVGIEHIINVIIISQKTDQIDIKEAIKTGKFASVTVLDNNKEKVYFNTTTTANGLYKDKASQQYFKISDKTPLDTTNIIKIGIREAIDDRSFINDNFGSKIINAYRIGFTKNDHDPRKIRVTKKIFDSYILSAKDAKFNNERNKIIIDQQTKLKDGKTSKVDTKLFDRLQNNIQSLDRTRDKDSRDRLQINDNLITDNDIIDAGIDVADTHAISTFIRQHGYAIIPDEILRMPNKNNLKRYFEHNPIIQRYIRRMKKSIKNHTAPMARGESPEEAKDRVDSTALFKSLGQEMFVILDDDILEFN
jgi:hypothetical protein